MTESDAGVSAVDEYISQYPPEIKERLLKMKSLVLKIVPDAEEKISWQMPSFLKNGYVLQFAVQKKHIGLYPGPEAIEVFKEKLADYKTTKGGVQLPFDKPMPYEIIEEIIHFNSEKNNAKAAAKETKTKKS